MQARGGNKFDTERLLEHLICRRHRRPKTEAARVMSRRSAGSTEWQLTASTLLTYNSSYVEDD